MIHTIRTSRFSKLISSYLAIQLVLTTVQPTNLYALTGGPSQPEFNSFTPIGTSDMVNLASGDFNYNIPIMDVGGYPLNLSYDSGITMDQESSWVGLGWNLNVGQINRQVRGLPDDFKGDEMTYENNLKDNKTIGGHIMFHPAFWGVDFPLELGIGLGVNYNNYSGWSYSSTAGVSLAMANNNSIGLDMTSSSNDGVSITPAVALNGLKFGSKKFSLSTSLGATYNSRQGLTSLTISPSLYKNDNKVGIGGSLLKGGSSHTKSFLTTSFTPTKRNRMINQNIKGNAAFGAEFFGVEGQLELYAFASKQALADEEESKTEHAYGFNFTEHASDHDILDFNRQNDRIVNKHTSILPITNYTYDLYSINGHGASGMYQPYRSQVGYVYDKYVKDISRDGSLGVEVGIATIAHTNVELIYSPSNSSTGVWNGASNAARLNFVQTTGNAPEYEKVFYKSIGDLNVDHDNLLSSYLGGESPIRIGLRSGNLNKKSIGGAYFSGHQELTNEIGFPDKINREQRLVRNKSIQTITKLEAKDFYNGYDEADFEPKIHKDAKDHHNIATRILQEDGSTYVFGQPAYNAIKQEVTFNASDITEYIGDRSEEVMKYSSGNDNAAGNDNGTDNYFNRVTTPAYAHTYLLTEVLSSDYEDLSGNGPTEDDLGSYTKFYYDDHNTSGSEESNTPYKWRVPFEEESATSNKGLYTLQGDDMGNYVYGEKELFYVKKIETKTHVAEFKLNIRNDGYGVEGQNGGLSPDSKMYQLKTISLYSKPEYALKVAGDTSIKPIKVAHFEYNYSLCEGVPNNSVNNDLDDNESNFGGDLGGKLTLKSVYFTYRNSNMGKYTPYVFDYDENNLESNPNYHIKGYNLWGNYKDPSAKGHNYNDEPTTAEFPYINQHKEEQENKNAAAWTLRSINLPSGGKLKMDYEADDYNHVQEKKALQMFKVRGVGTSNNPTSPYNSKLYGNSKKKYMYVELESESDINTITPEIFEEKYLSTIIKDPIYFRFLLNMVRGNNKASDFVEGYFKIDNTKDCDECEVCETCEVRKYPFNVFESDNKIFGAIPVHFVHLNKSRTEDSSSGEHPIAKAGWYFGRQYLNSVVYGGDEYAQNLDVLGVAWNIVNQLGHMYALFIGPNTELKNNGCAQFFSNTKSWIRLQSPKDKIGGGIKVTKVEMFDEWDTMVQGSNEENEHLYKMSYGQEYSYTDTDGNSSGVATFEPFGSKENPFIEPYYDNVNDDKLLAPEEQGYTEKPFGVSFFPSAKVTYGRVTVKNLSRGTYTNNGTNFEVGNNGTGKVVSEFFTSKNYPTITKHTTLDGPHAIDFPPGGLSILASVLGINVYTEKALSMSQGFSIITNDMDGKQMSQAVFRESIPDTPVSKVEYFYDVDENGNLDNNLLTINDKGLVKESTIGIDYNVVNDFRNSKSSLQSYGADINIGATVYGILPFLGVTVIPLVSIHTTELKMATTTKVIHKTGIMVEKKAMDLGAEVTTKNIAWDAETGQVILTQTDNEYKNDRYYNFNYPAYWFYNGMSSASNNLGISLTLDQANNNVYTIANASKYLFDGDEVFAKVGENTVRYWVTELNGNSFSLINREGSFMNNADKIKVIRSGYRNLQNSSMASITLMNNPIDIDEVDDNNNYNDLDQDSFKANTWEKQKIVNASAIKYSDTWPAPCECNAPKMTYNDLGEIVFVHEGDDAYNPYVNNIKGEWRATESYAYLTGRYNDDDNDIVGVNDNLGYNPRKAGLFMSFDPFYKLTSSNGSWYIEPTIDTPQGNWTSASQVTQYSPYGAELENKDALNRYSSAQYGYNYKFPVAVASNGQYNEIGFDGFEDNSSDCDNEHFKIKNLNNNANSEINGLNSHSGKNSLKVNPNSAAVLEIRIKQCPEGQGEGPNSGSN